MPENAAARVGPRSALPAPSTGYEIAQVVKGPTPNDPYSPAAAGPSKANDLIQALGIVDKQIIPLAVQGGELWAGEQKKAGADARFVGDALDPNQSNAFIDGFERMDGQYRGVQFANAAKEYATTNSHLPPDEFQKGLDELQKTYVGQLIHQGQLDTFLPDALKGGEHATAIYQESKNAQVMTERNQKTQDIQEGKMKIVLDQAALDVAGIPLSSGFASVGTDPEMRKKLFDNMDAFRAVVSPQLRAIHDETRTAFRDLGLTPAAIATKFVGTVGRLAGDVGVLGINDYMYQKDQAGMSPESANPELVNKLSDQARTMGAHIDAAMLVKQEKADKAALEFRNTQRFISLANPGTTPEQAKQIILDISQETKMDADTAFKMSNHAFDIMLGQGFALKDKEAVYRQLEDVVGTGKITGEPAYRLLMEHAHDLSHPTYQHLMEKAQAIANRKGDTAKDRSWAMFQNESNTYKASIIRTLGLQDEQGKVMIGLESNAKALMDLAKVTTDGVDGWFRGIERLAAKYGGLEDNIPGAELKSLHDSIIALQRPRTDFISKNAQNPIDQPGQNVAPQTAEQKKATPPSVKTGKISDITLPPGIPEGSIPTGKTINGKPAFLSPDGKTIMTGGR